MSALPLQVRSYFKEDVEVIFVPSEGVLLSDKILLACVYIILMAHCKLDWSKVNIIEGQIDQIDTE